MKAAELFVQALEKAEVRYLFGLPGSTEAPLLDTFVSGTSFDYLLALHENIAVGMADGYARASDRAGVASLHTSVGTMNALSAIYNAWRDKSAVVVTAGHKDTRIHSRDGFCTIPNISGLPRDFTKWSWESRRAEQIGPDLRRAMKIAGTHPCGPTYLAIPEDLAATEISRETAEPLAETGWQERGAEPWSPPAGVRCSQEILERTGQWVSQAKHPVMIAGDGIAQRNAWSQAAHVAEMLGLPVLQEPRRSASTINFPQDHALYAGTYSVDHPLVQEADLILAVGCRLFVEFSPPNRPEIPAQTRLIHVHSDPWELSKNYPADLAIASDCDLFLKDLLKWSKRNSSEDDPRRARSEARIREQQQNTSDVNAKYSTNYPDKVPVPVEYLVSEMARILPPETVIIDEGVRSSRQLLNGYTFRYPGSYHTTTGGALGWGLPAALGVKLAHPGRPVLAYVGDGSALFSLQALWTAARYKIPVVTVICNNQGYLAVKSAIDEYQGLAAQRQIFPGSALNEPATDFVHLAKGYGVPAWQVEHPSHLGELLQRCLDADGPTLLDVPIPPVAT